MAQELTDWQRQLAAGIAEATSLDNIDRGPIAAGMFTCPDTIPEPDAVVGCGRTFHAVPDDEGFVDCPHCGMFFQPLHPANSPGSHTPEIDRGPVTQGAELTDESAWDAFDLQRGGVGKGERLARANDAHALDLQIQLQGCIGELPR